MNKKEWLAQIKKGTDGLFYVKGAEWFDGFKTKKDAIRAMENDIL